MNTDVFFELKKHFPNIFPTNIAWNNEHIDCTFPLSIAKFYSYFPCKRKYFPKSVFTYLFEWWTLNLCRTIAWGNYFILLGENRLIYRLSQKLYTIWLQEIELVSVKKNFYDFSSCIPIINEHLNIQNIIAQTIEVK